MGYYLLTGATGLLGSYLLRDALLAEVPVVVLVRAADAFQARTRIEECLQGFERQSGHTLPRPVVLAGDLSQEHLGLDPTTVDWLARNVTTVIHSAASLHFTTTPEGEPWASNVVGCWNLLRLCRRFDNVDFHHVSTAYVCGLRRETVREDDLVVGQEFGNPYEVSKVLAERMLRDATWLRSLTIYRPSIIVGDSKSGFSSTFHGFYRPLQLAHTLSRGRAAEAVPLLTQLGLRGDERKNLVPVDWVASVVSHIVRTPASHGRVYHLTNPLPVSVDTMDRAIAATIHDTAFASTTLPAARQASLGAPSVSDQQFLTGMGHYRSYLRDDPDFDRTNTLAAAGHLPCPTLDVDRLALLGRSAIEANFERPRVQLEDDALDCHRWFASFAQSAARMAVDSTAMRVNLQITGPWGGTWHADVGARRSLRKAEGFDSAAACNVRMSTPTLRALVCGNWNMSAAIHAGLVLIRHLRQATADSAAAACTRWIDHLRQSTDGPRTVPSDGPPRQTTTANW